MTRYQKEILWGSIDLIVTGVLGIAMIICLFAVGDRLASPQEEKMALLWTVTFGFVLYAYKEVFKNIIIPSIKRTPK